MGYSDWRARQIAVHRNGVHAQLARLATAQENLRLANKCPAFARGDTRRNRCLRIGRAVRELERHAAALRMLQGAV